MSAPSPGTAAAVAARVRHRRAWYVYDWANSGYVTTSATVLFTPYLTAVATAAACPGGSGVVDGVCTTDLSVLGLPVSPGSLALYVVTAGTVLSALALPVVGTIADRSPAPRRLLGALAWTGAAAAASMVFVAGANWQLGALLEIIASVCLGSSLAVYNALLISVAAPHERDAVSSRGWALGYAGGGLLLGVNLAVVTGHEALGLSRSGAVRASLLVAGLWWAVFTLVPYLGLRGLDQRAPLGREHPPPRGRGPRSGDGRPQGGLGSAVLATLTELRETLLGARAHPQTLLFLAAFLLFNDGVQTVISTASLYGGAELGLATEQLITTILLVQFVALGGALAFGALAASVGAQRAVLVSLVAWVVVVLGGLALPAGRFGLFLVLATGIGVVLGGTQALSRSLYSRLVPRGREAAYFSLYQALERGTSWFGTLVFGLTYQLTGSYRPALASLLVFFLAGGVLLARVDVSAGITAADGGADGGAPAAR